MTYQEFCHRLGEMIESNPVPVSDWPNCSHRMNEDFNELANEFYAEKELANR